MLTMEALPYIALALSALSVLISLLKNTNAGVASFARLEVEHKEFREDLHEVKSVVLELSKALSQLAVLQAQRSSDNEEIQRTRTRLHDLEERVRGLLAWRQTEDPNYGKRV